MDILYYKDPHLNFGDDLNEVLWDRLFSTQAFDVEDVTLVGIGSILSEERVGHLPHSGRRVIVLGSGTSYDAPPKAIEDCRVLAVRGPLTAQVIGMPGTAVTDAAILLAAVPGLLPAHGTRSDVAFMPHHRSIRHTPWREITEEAGMRFISPQEPVDEVLAAMAGARLIVTEAMHGAIVADTMRIPWVPIVTTPTIDEFKWRDWTLSMDLPYQPVPVAVGDGRDVMANLRKRRILEQGGISGHRMVETAQSKADLEAYLARRFDPQMKKALLNIYPGRIGRSLDRLSRFMNPVHRQRAAQSLKAAAATAPFLSSELIFSQRLEEMSEAVQVAERFILSGQ